MKDYSDGRCDLGAHLNPAVSLALAVVGKFPVISLIHYILAQYLGAWLGSALVLLTYRYTSPQHEQGWKAFSCE